MYTFHNGFILVFSLKFLLCSIGLFYLSYLFTRNQCKFGPQDFSIILKEILDDIYGSQIEIPHKDTLQKEIDKHNGVLGIDKVVPL